MNSPFPGMDPYLEGHLWTDVHHRLATEISRALTPILRPRYTARLAMTIFHETISSEEIDIFMPDVEVLTHVDSLWQKIPVEETGNTMVMTPMVMQPIMIPLPEVDVQVASVEIYDVAKHQLITSIEILSPVNKREPGLTQYREKQQQLREAGIHLLEIDLLRRGQRRLQSPFTHFQKLLDKIHYLVALTRAGAKSCGIWPIRLQDALPVVPVPLRAPDPDVELNLAEALKNIYQEAAYDLSIDYSAEPPPPTLDEYDAEWVQRLLANRASNLSDEVDK